MSTEKDALRGTLSNSICNASLYPKRAQPHILGGDMTDVLDRTADNLIAAGYRKVETVWAETLINDGTYEYTSSSDCDGSNVYHWRRKPSVQLEMVYSPWESYAPEGDN